MNQGNARERIYYGVPIGILMLDTRFQRHNGDIGNAQTWPFPVQYKVVRGALPNKVVDTLNNPDLFQRYAQLSFWRDLKGSKAFRIVSQGSAEKQRETMPESAQPIAPEAAR